MKDETPAPQAPPTHPRFTTAEVSFFDTGQMIETGQMVLPEATSDRGRLRRWARHSPGLAAGFACSVLVVVGFLIGSAGDESHIPPAALVTTAPAPVPVAPVIAAPKVQKPRPERTESAEKAEPRAPRAEAKAAASDRRSSATSGRKQSRRHSRTRHASGR